jgi:hypothetical protein
MSGGEPQETRWKVFGELKAPVFKHRISKVDAPMLVPSSV